MMLAYSKAIAAFIGSIATALLGIYAADTYFGQVLTIVGVIATTVATFQVPNKPQPTHDEDGALSAIDALVVVLLVVVILAVIGVL